MTDELHNHIAGKPADVTAARYLIWKQGAFYRPNSQGYTTSAIQAGRYTLDDAIDITHPNGPDGPRDGMGYVHEDEVFDADWQAYQALAAALAEQTARAEAAEARVAEQNAKLEAHVQVDAAHIRAEAMREAAGVARGLGMAELENSATPLGPRTQAFYGSHDAILALIPTPAPSPDVGAQIADAVKAERERCAKLADAYADENIRMAGDSVIFDPVLSSRSGQMLTKEDFEKSEALILEGAIHSSMFHAAQNIAASIRALAAQEGGDD